jgi:hypothetical protein
MAGLAIDVYGLDLSSSNGDLTLFSKLAIARAVQLSESSAYLDEVNITAQWVNEQSAMHLMTYCF